MEVEIDVPNLISKNQKKELNNAPGLSLRRFALIIMYAACDGF